MQNVCIMNAPQPVTTLTILQFRSRFTSSEKEAIYTAAKTVALVQAWLDDLASAKDDMVDLADPRISGGVNGLVSAGILTPTRAAEILAP